MQGKNISGFTPKTAAEQEQMPTTDSPDHTYMLKTDLGEAVADKAWASWALQYLMKELAEDPMS